MILLSLFMGISINGMWAILYRFEFFVFFELPNKKPMDFIIWSIVVLSHFGVLTLPFFVENRLFKKLLLYFPMIYLLGYLVLEAGHFILLLPFMVVWIITLINARKLKYNSKAEY